MKGPGASVKAQPQRVYGRSCRGSLGLAARLAASCRSRAVLLGRVGSGLMHGARIAS